MPYAFLLRGIPNLLSLLAYIPIPLEVDVWLDGIYFAPT